MIPGSGWDCVYSLNLLPYLLGAWLRCGQPGLLEVLCDTTNLKGVTA